MPDNSDQLETINAETSALPVLTLLRPVSEGAGAPTVSLRRAVTLIGSRSTARVHLKSSTVSKAHCLVVVTPTGAFVRDLLSREGTLVNGDARLEQDLVDGDEITVGRFTFRFDDPRSLPAKTDDRAMPEAVVLKMAVGDERPKKAVGARRVVLIGQRAGSDVVLNDPRVSTAHAAIVRVDGLSGNGGEWAVIDLGGRGSKLNGKPLTRARMASGDILAVGPALMRLSFTKPEKLAQLAKRAAAAPPPEPLEAEAPAPESEAVPAPAADVVEDTEDVPVDEQLLDEAGLEDVFDDSESERAVATEPDADQLHGAHDEAPEQAAPTLQEVVAEPAIPDIAPDEETLVAEMEATVEPDELQQPSDDDADAVVAASEPETKAIIEELDGKYGEADTDLAVAPAPEPPVQFGGEPEDDASEIDLSRIAFDRDVTDEALADERTEVEPEPVAEAPPVEEPGVEDVVAPVDPRRKGRRTRRLSDPITPAKSSVSSTPVARDAAEFVPPPPPPEPEAEAATADAVETEPPADHAETEAQVTNEPGLDEEFDLGQIDLTISPEAPAPTTLPATDPTPASAFAADDLGEFSDDDAAGSPQTLAPADDSFASSDADAELPDDEEFVEQIAGLSDSLTGELVDAQAEQPDEGIDDESHPSDDLDEPVADGDSSTDDDSTGMPANWQANDAAHFDIGTPISLSAVDDVSPWGPDASDAFIDASTDAPAEADAPVAASSASSIVDPPVADTSRALEEPNDDESSNVGHDSGLPTPYDQEPVDLDEADDEDSSATESPPEGWLDAPHTPMPPAGRDEPSDEPATVPEVKPRPHPPGQSPRGRKKGRRPVRVGFGGETEQTDSSIQPRSRASSGPFSSTSLPGAAPARPDSASESWALDASTVIPEASGLLGAADVFGFDPPTALTSEAQTDPVDPSEHAGDVATAGSSEFEDDIDEPPTGSFLQTVREGVHPSNGSRHEGVNGHTSGHVNGHAGTAVAEAPRVRPATPAPRKPRPRFDRKPVLSVAPIDDGTRQRSRGVRLISLLAAMLVAMVVAFVGVQTLMAPTTDVTLLVNYQTPAAMTPERIADFEREQIRRVFSAEVRREAIASLARTSPTLEPGWLNETTDDEGDGGSVTARMDVVSQQPILLLTTTTKRPADDAKRLLALGSALEAAGGVERAQAEALDQSIRDDQLELARLQERLTDAIGEVEVAQAELAMPVTAPDADPELLQTRIAAADAEWAEASESAARLQVRLRELEATEVGAGDTALDELRNELIEIETKLLTNPPDAPDLREQAAEVNRKIQQREAELLGERVAATQSLRRDAAAAEVKAQQARRRAQDAREELSAVELRKEELRRRQQDLVVKRDTVGDHEKDIARVSTRLTGNTEQRNQLGYPNAVVENNVVRIAEEDERFKYMIIALVGVFALFLIPIYFTLRSPGF